jgi:hypothetical protein
MTRTNLRKRAKARGMLRKVFRVEPKSDGLRKKEAKKTKTKNKRIFRKIWRKLI